MRIKDCDLQKIMDSGQCFRLRKENDRFLVLSENQYAWAEQVGKDAEIHSENHEYWGRYFQTDVNFEALGDYFKSCCDNEFIHKSVDFSRGLRMLNQSPFETLISFILSQRKNIPAIRGCVEDLCRRCGDKLDENIYAFPTPAQISNDDIEMVKGIGYRSRYVMHAASGVDLGIFNLEMCRTMEYGQALGCLKKILGVGDKVANCVLLYSLGFRDSFPLDVWVQRIIDEDFNGSFPYECFEHDLGVLQLWMYYYKRCGE